jgi:hypothetical protein
MSSHPPFPAGDEKSGSPLEIWRLEFRRELIRSARMCGRIRRVLQRLNPGGTGFDDRLLHYDYEARMILQRLFRCRCEADACRAIRKVFGERFGSPSVFSFERFSDTAREIWGFWKSDGKKT